MLFNALSGRNVQHKSRRSNSRRRRRMALQRFIQQACPSCTSSLASSRLRLPLGAYSGAKLWGVYKASTADLPIENRLHRLRMLPESAGRGVGLLISFIAFFELVYFLSDGPVMEGRMRKRRNRWSVTVSRGICSHGSPSQCLTFSILGGP